MNEVIKKLQESVSLHLTAVETYIGQAAFLRRWGFPGLAKLATDDAKEEQEHLERLLARIEFYSAEPKYDHIQPSWPRRIVSGILESNLVLEEKAAETEKAAIETCRRLGDEISAAIFAENLKGSEDSILQLEAFIEVIALVGEQNFLTNYAKD